MPINSPSYVSLDYFPLCATTAFYDNLNSQNQVAELESNSCVKILTYDATLPSIKTQPPINAMKNDPSIRTETYVLVNSAKTVIKALD